MLWFHKSECLTCCEAILKKSERLSGFIIKILVDKIIFNIGGLIQFTKNNFISWILNWVDQHYCKAKKSLIKAKLKIDVGLLGCLVLFMGKELI